MWSGCRGASASSTIARLGAERLWKLMQTEPYVAALGALTGAQAVQMVKAGLQAIYLSGGRSRRTATSPLTRTRDQSLYPANSAPALVKRMNNALLRADQIDAAEGETARTGSRPSSRTPRPASAAL